jgi:hypothetical protein
MDIGDDLLAEVPAKAARKRKPRNAGNGRFVKIGEQLLICLAEVLGSAKEMAVALHIQQRVMIEGSSTIKVTNQALAPWGVGRAIKRRALAKLASAGLIEFVERSNAANPRIRIIGSLWLAASNVL